MSTSWMADEQIVSDANLLGCILWAVVHGRTPKQAAPSDWLADVICWSTDGWNTTLYCGGDCEEVGWEERQQGSVISVQMLKSRGEAMIHMLHAVLSIKWQIAISSSASTCSNKSGVYPVICTFYKSLLLSFNPFDYTTPCRWGGETNQIVDQVDQLSTTKMAPHNTSSLTIFPKQLLSAGLT